MQNVYTNLTLFSIIILGWVLKRSGRITDSGLKELTSLLFMPLMPVSFFTSGLGFNPALMDSSRFVVVLLSGYVIATVIACVLAWGRKGMTKERRAVSILASVRPNSIFIGLPLMTVWLGQAGIENMLMCLACTLPYFNVVPLTISFIALNGKFDRKATLDALRKTFTNPIFLGSAAGLLMGGMGWSHIIPEWVMRALKLLTGAGTGLSLIVIGASIVPETLIEDVKCAWPDMMMKLFIHPAVIFIAFLLFPVENVVSMKVAVIAAAIAPAFNCFVLAKGFDMDGDYAASLVTSSTLLCMATLLFWMFMTAHFFG